MIYNYYAYLCTYHCYRNSHCRINRGVIDSYGAAYGCYNAAQITTEYGWLSTERNWYALKNPGTSKLITQTFDGEGYLRELTNMFV